MRCPASSLVPSVQITMSAEFLAERSAILADLAAIEADIAELAEVLATNLGPEVGRRLARDNSPP